MKNLFSKLTLFVLSLVALVALTACNNAQTEEPTNEQNKGNGEIVYTDVIETPDDIPTLEFLEYISYPTKPEGLTPGQGEGVPTVGTASTESTGYQITQENGVISVSFTEVENWDYIFLPISNFNEEYQNIKITATASNVQKIAIAAVYAEMYNESLPMVTTFIGDVGDTEQFYIMELGKTNLLNTSYYPLEETLGTQTVFGLCIFLDSNPSQNVVNKDYEKTSTFEISSVEFLKDGDPAIGDRYVEPSLRVGYTDPGYIAEKNDETKEYTITKTSNAVLYESATLDISNYSSAYSAFKLVFTTQNINTIVIELQFTGGKENWVPKTEVYRVTNLEDGQHEAYIDFSFNQPQDNVTWGYVAGYYVKNYKVTGLSFFLDTSLQSDVKAEEGVCVINELKFERLATDGVLVTKGWNAGAATLTLGDDLANGGIGTINYSWHSTWECLTMPVANYEPANKLTIKLQANDGLNYLGIALGCGQFATGEAVLSSSWTSIPDKMKTPELKGNEVEGVVETIEYDSVNKIYTITFDFTNAKKLDAHDGKSVNELLITSLRFYFTDYNSKDVFEGTRSIRFISIDFE